MIELHKKALTVYSHLGLQGLGLPGISETISFKDERRTISFKDERSGGREGGREGLAEGGRVRVHKEEVLECRAHPDLQGRLEKQAF